MLGKPGDHIERQFAALKIRIGVEDDRQIDRVRDGAEIALDLGIPQRKIGFEDGENAGGAAFGVSLRLGDRISDAGGTDARHDRHAAGGGFDRDFDGAQALLAAEIGKLAGAAERS